MWNFNHTEHINCYKLNIVLKFIIFSDGPGHKIEKKNGICIFIKCCVQNLASAFLSSET